MAKERKEVRNMNEVVEKAKNLKTPIGYTLAAVASKRDEERILKVLKAAGYKNKIKRFKHGGREYYAVYVPTKVKPIVTDLLIKVKENGISAAMALLYGAVGGAASGLASEFVKEHYRRTKRNKFKMEDIIEERNKYARQFKKGTRVVVSTSSVHGYGTVTSVRYSYNLAEYPRVYVKMDDGRKISVPIIGVQKIESKKNVRHRRGKVCVPPTTYVREGKVIHRRGYCRTLPKHVKSGEMRIPPAGVVPRKEQEKIEKRARRELLEKLKKVHGTAMNIGKYWRIQILPPELFKRGSFRTHDIGRKGGHKRIAGILKSTGRWATQSFLLPLDWYERKGSELTPLTDRAKRFWSGFKKKYVQKWVGGARFVAVPKSAKYYAKSNVPKEIVEAATEGVPEWAKPTRVMKRAHSLASRALKLAAKYRRQGMSKSEALKRAWRLIEGKYKKKVRSKENLNLVEYLSAVVNIGEAIKKLPKKSGNPLLDEYIAMLRGIGLCLGDAGVDSLVDKHSLPLLNEVMKTGIIELKDIPELIDEIDKYREANAFAFTVKRKEVEPVEVKENKTKENGQYFLPVNLDKEEYFEPKWGWKLWEMCYNEDYSTLLWLKYPTTGLAALTTPNWKYVGRWEGNKVVTVGDYDSSGLFKKAEENFKKIDHEKVISEGKKFIKESPIVKEMGWVIVNPKRKEYISYEDLLPFPVNLRSMMNLKLLNIIFFLTRKSNEGGGGDVNTDVFTMAGRWAGEPISIMKASEFDKEGYTHLKEAEDQFLEFVEWWTFISEYTTSKKNPQMKVLMLFDDAQMANELQGLLSDSGINSKVKNVKGFYAVFASREQYNLASKIRDAYLKNEIPVAANPHGFAVEVARCPRDGTVLQFVRLGTKPDGNVAPVFRCPKCGSEYFL